jgi:phage terminase small subunit
MGKAKAAPPKKPQKQKKYLKISENSEKLTLPYDFPGLKLTQREKAFVVNYIHPGQPCFHNALQSALKAGYSASMASAAAVVILRRPDIQKIVQRYEAEAYKSLHEAAQRFMQEKIARASIDPTEFYDVEEEEVETRSGQTFIKRSLRMKDFEAIPPEKRVAIDGVTVAGKHDVPVYVLADRQKERDSIIALDRELNRKGGDNGQDVEELKEIVIERVTIRQERRSARAENIKYRVVNRPDDLEEEL